jgi:catechol 2,3-dioxygenase-like lactoylglutathione lyase family enzyme
MTDREPLLNQVNLVVREMEATVAFYRRLGMPLDVAPGARHAAARLPNGVSLEFDTTDFVPQFDSGWSGATGGSTVLGFQVGSREAVDEIYAGLTAAGYRGRQRPYDAFWGARYAIVDDPDGNGVGFMSPIEESRKSWPPEPPPKGG